MNKITKNKTHLIIKIPLRTKRFNPYNEMYLGDGYTGDMDNIIGLIIPDKRSSEPEIGFANYIDMDYKGKEDQWTNIFYHYYGDKEDFIKLCKDLKIDIYEYSKCAYCGGPIYGCFTHGKKGNMCSACEYKKNEKME